MIDFIKHCADADQILFLSDGTMIQSSFEDADHYLTVISGPAIPRLQGPWQDDVPF